MKQKIKISDLEEWFEDPEETLSNFMESGQAIFIIQFYNSRRPIELNQRDVGNLLIEIRKRKVWTCEYCRITNSGEFGECITCGAPRK